MHEPKAEEPAGTITPTSGKSGCRPSPDANRRSVRQDMPQANTSQTQARRDASPAIAAAIFRTSALTRPPVTFAWS